MTRLEAVFVFFSLISSLSCQQSLEKSSVFIYDYWPNSQCDLENPRNQEAFEGFEFDLYLEFIEEIGWNQTKFDMSFKCIFSSTEAYSALYEGVEEAEGYNYLFCPDGWSSSWVSKTSSYWPASQPYHDIPFVAIKGTSFPTFLHSKADYQQKRWLFLQNVDIEVIVVLFALPLALAFILQPTMKKNHWFYLASDFTGLLFFQPEINFKRNISMKIFSFFIQLASLVFLSYYFVILEDSLNDLSSFGNESAEAGLFKVWVYLDPPYYSAVLKTLALPKEMENDMITVDSLQEHSEQNPGEIYIIITSIAQALIQMGSFP